LFDQWAFQNKDDIDS